jgi:rhodanese-related sulfurtransferase
MPITKSAESLVKAAMQEVTTLSPAHFIARTTAGDRQMLVDIRDVRELQAEGAAVGAYHAPRCLLEFWVDPASPYHKPALADESITYVLYCGLGWRSALAAKTLQDMGMTNVAHIEGGFAAMQAAGMPIETWEQRKVKK